MTRALLLPLLLAIALPAFAQTSQPSQWDAIRTAATAGNADAQFALAQAYQLGRGMPVDRDMAVMWYRRAADQGHLRASDELGFLLFQKGDRHEAMPYIEKAAARGEPRAFYLLGTAHFNGDYATRDWPLAYAQTERAIEGGLTAARTNLEMMGHYLLPADRAKADAILATLPPVKKRSAAPSPGPASPQPVAKAAAIPPSPAKPIPPAAKPTPPPARPALAAAAAPAAKGSWRVQLGAFGSVDRARTAWTTLSAKVPALGRLDQRIVAAGAVQRLQATGLADRTAAEALCRQVRDAKGDCLVMAP